MLTDDHFPNGFVIDFQATRANFAWAVVMS